MNTSSGLSGSSAPRKGLVPRKYSYGILERNYRGTDQFATMKTQQRAGRQLGPHKRFQCRAGTRMEFCEEFGKLSLRSVCSHADLAAVLSDSPAPKRCGFSLALAWCFHFHAVRGGPSRCACLLTESPCEWQVPAA